jgi:hypothetical protein
MNVGVLGSGAVAQTLAANVAGPGHDVVLGTRNVTCGGAEGEAVSGGPRVGVVEAAEHRSRPDRSGGEPDGRERCLELEGSVGTGAVVAPGELGEDGAEVSLVAHDQVIQALAPEGAGEPLFDRVGPRGPHGRQQRLDPQPRQPASEGAAEHSVPVPQLEAGPPAPGGGLDQLAPDPGGGRVAGYCDAHQLTTPVRDEHLAWAQPRTGAPAATGRHRTATSASEALAP